MTVNRSCVLNRVSCSTLRLLFYALIELGAWRVPTVEINRILVLSLFNSPGDFSLMNAGVVNDDENSPTITRP